MQNSNKCANRAFIKLSAFIVHNLPHEVRERSKAWPNKRVETTIAIASSSQTFSYRMNIDGSVSYFRVDVNSVREVLDSKRRFCTTAVETTSGKEYIVGIGFDTRSQARAFLDAISSSDRQSGSAWLQLSDEMLIFIFGFLEAPELTRASGVCTRWHRIAQDASLWRALHSRIFGAAAPRPPNTSPRDLYLQCVEAQRRHAAAVSGAATVAPRRGSGPNGGGAGGDRGNAHPVKLVAVGDQLASEKTTLLLSFAHDKFPEDYVPTVFENFVVPISVDGRSVELSLWDTSGAEEYDRLRPLSYANAQVFLLVFSVVEQASFEHIVTKWFPEVAHFCPDVPRVLVGTQIELRDDAETVERLQSQGKRCITLPEAEATASRVKAICYLECSSRTGENRRRVFEEAVRAALSSQRSIDLGCVLS